MKLLYYFSEKLAVSTLVIYIAVISSCMPVMKVVYGLHKPRFLTDEAVLHYADRLKLDGSIYRLNHYSEETRKAFRYLGVAMPEVLLFNADGQMVHFELDCSSKLDSIARLSLGDIERMNIDQPALADLDKDLYQIGNGSALDIRQLEKPLYVVKFGEYAGKLNRGFLPGVIEILKKREDVEYLLLDMDYTELSRKN